MQHPESPTNPPAIPRNVFVSVLGVFIGLFFGVPPAWGAHDMGLPWAPYGIAVIVMCLTAGLLIAFTVDALVPRTQERAAEAQTAMKSEETPLEPFDAWSERLDREVKELDHRMRRVGKRGKAR